jgi:hypothetical protein
MIFHLAYPENVTSKSLKDTPSKVRLYAILFPGSFFMTFFHLVMTVLFNLHI